MPSVITVFEPKTKEAMISNTVKVMVPPSDSLKILFSVLYFSWSIINKKSFLFLLTSESGIQWDDHVLHIVLMLAVQQNDRKKFMELYNGIVQTLEKPEKVNKLVLADNLMDFLNQLLEK